MTGAACGSQPDRARRLHLDGGRRRAGLRAARRHRLARAWSVVEMGGAGTASEDNRVTEAAVRGFWKAYRSQMGL